MERIAVSGIGIVAPGGFGREAWLRMLSMPRDGEAAYRVPDFTLEEHLEGGRAFRRVANATKFALAALALAVKDAGFATAAFGGERTGIVVGVTHGAVGYSVQFHRVLMLEGPLPASPMHFAESVPNAPAGNGAIAFRVRGPVHTLIGEETVGTQTIDLAAGLLRERVIERCLVAGAEEWNEVVAHAYAQIDRATRGSREPDAVPPLTEGAAALVLELEGTAARRAATPHALISGWCLGRCLPERMEEAIAEVAREAFRPTEHGVADADHILIPTGRYRRAAARGAVAARGEGVPPPVWVDLAPLAGNPAGASGLLQVATSAALMSAGKVEGPGLCLSTGIEGTLAAVAVSRADREGRGWTS